MRRIAATIVLTVGCHGPADGQTTKPDPPSSADASDHGLGDGAVTETDLSTLATAAPAPHDETPTAPPRPQRVIYRDELTRATAGGPGYLMRQLGPEPVRNGGRFYGWRITRVFPDDPQLCAPGCDIEVGDIVLTVQGSRIETPDALTTLMQRLPKDRALQVSRVRRGVLDRVQYEIVD